RGPDTALCMTAPSTRPCLAAVNREPVAGESLRHLGSTLGTERRPAETLGIVPAGHHVMTVRGDSDRGLTSPQKARRSRRLRCVDTHVRTHRAGILASLFGGVPGARRSAQFELPGRN